MGGNSRAILHKNKLKEFSAWLVKQGYEIVKKTGNKAVLYAVKKGEAPVLVLDRETKGGKCVEHLFIREKDLPLVRRFIADVKAERKKAELDASDIVRLEKRLAELREMDAHCPTCFHSKEPYPCCYSCVFPVLRGANPMKVTATDVCTEYEKRATL